MKRYGVQIEVQDEHGHNAREFKYDDLSVDEYLDILETVEYLSPEARILNTWWYEEE